MSDWADAVVGAKARRRRAVSRDRGLVFVISDSGPLLSSGRDQSVAQLDPRGDCVRGQPDTLLLETMLPMPLQKMWVRTLGWPLRSKRVATLIDKGPNAFGIVGLS